MEMRQKTTTQEKERALPPEVWDLATNHEVKKHVLLLI